MKFVDPDGREMMVFPQSDVVRKAWESLFVRRVTNVEQQLVVMKEESLVVDYFRLRIHLERKYVTNLWATERAQVPFGRILTIPVYVELDLFRTFLKGHWGGEILLQAFSLNWDDSSVSSILATLQNYEVFMAVCFGSVWKHCAEGLRDFLLSSHAQQWPSLAVHIMEEALTWTFSDLCSNFIPTVGGPDSLREPGDVRKYYDTQLCAGLILPLDRISAWSRQVEGSPQAKKQRGVSKSPPSPR